MKKITTPEFASSTITALSHDGRGITHYQDKTTFVDGALPNEEVKYQITKKHRRYLEAKVSEILVAAKDRTHPPCKHFGVCGGCSMQHLMQAAQIEYKQKTLLEQLKHFGGVEPKNLLPPISGSSEGYRRKARLGVRYIHKKQKLLIGFREKHSNFLADIETCPVLHPAIGMKLPKLRELIEQLSIYQDIPQVEVAISDTEASLVFRHLAPFTPEDGEKIIDFAKAHDFHIYLQPNPPAAIHKLWPQNSIDRLTYCLKDYDVKFQFHPLDFTQINGEINVLMVKQALALLAPTKQLTVLDLFCGLGNFTLPLARLAKQVMGVEGSTEMVERAKRNAELNGITNTDFAAANLAKLPAPLPAWLQKTYDLILLDPPRTGAKEVIELFPKFSAKRIVYVSCNPATLARDAGILVHTQGYTLTHAGIINMFPHTSHVEAIACFERG